LYVEYSFLDYKGYLLETPQAMPVPVFPMDPIYYHFRQRFELKNEHEKQLQILKSMLVKDSKVPLRFLIVNEPLQKRTESDCEEVG